jgi:hypothetical protein
MLITTTSASHGNDWWVNPLCSFLSLPCLLRRSRQQYDKTSMFPFLTLSGVAIQLHGMVWALPLV